MACGSHPLLVGTWRARRGAATNHIIVDALLWRTILTLNCRYVEVQTRGGGVRAALTRDVSHVVCSLEDRTRFAAIKAIITHRLTSKMAIPYVVTEKWVEDSIERGVVQPVHGYRINLTSA